MSKKRGKGGSSKEIVEKYDIGTEGIKLIKKVTLSAKTEHQKELFKSIKNNMVTIVSGPAGSGKTIISVACGLSSFMNCEYGKMIYTRPCVEANHENLGFLPGDLNEKIYPYMIPIFDFLSDYLEVEQIENMIRSNRIQTIPLAFQRGITFKNAYVLLDEAQNTTPQQMRMFLTRIGDHCKIAITGDPNQSDIKGENGLSDAIKRLVGVNNIGIVEFTDEDIVRHPLVAKIEEKYLLELE